MLGGCSDSAAGSEARIVVDSRTSFNPLMSIPDSLLGRGGRDAVLLAPLAGNFELGRNIVLSVLATCMAGAPEPETCDDGFRRGRGGFDDDETRDDTSLLMILNRGEGALAGDCTGPGDCVDDVEEAFGVRVVTGGSSSESGTTIVDKVGL